MQLPEIGQTPNTGIHSIRLFNIAIIDVIITVLFAYFVSINYQYSFWLVLSILFVLGIVIHRLFKIRTTIDKILFNNND